MDPTKIGSKKDQMEVVGWVETIEEVELAIEVVS